MKKVTRGLVAVLLTASVGMSLTSCFGASKAVKETATEFMEAALDRDVEDMADMCEDDSDALAVFRPYEESFAPVDALLERATFKIGKISVKKENATAQVIITLPDYDAAAAEAGVADDFEDALDDQKDTTDIEITLEFELSGKDDWEVVNYEDFATEFYTELYLIDYDFESGYDGWISEDIWYYSDDGVYSNAASALDLDNRIVQDHYYDEMLYSFAVYHDSRLVYMSTLVRDSGYLENYCYASSVHLSGTSSFDSGSYTYVLYDSDGAAFHEATCTVR